MNTPCGKVPVHATANQAAYLLFFTQASAVCVYLLNVLYDIHVKRLWAGELNNCSAAHAQQRYTLKLRAGSLSVFYKSETMRSSRPSFLVIYFHFPSEQTPQTIV